MAGISRARAVEPGTAVTNLVLGRSGSGIGSKLKRTELNAEFRFKVQHLLEPNAVFEFGVRAVKVTFECRT
jgi:hypothetical protein